MAFIPDITKKLQDFLLKRYLYSRTKQQVDRNIDERLFIKQKR